MSEVVIVGLAVIVGVVAYKLFSRDKGDSSSGSSGISGGANKNKADIDKH